MPNVVLHLLNYCDNRLEASYLWDQRHKMRIFDSCEIVAGCATITFNTGRAISEFSFSSEYARAAEELNDRGMRQFKIGVEAMKKREKVMAVEWDGNGNPFVREKVRGHSGLHQMEGDDVVDDELDAVVAVPSKEVGKKLHNRKPLNTEGKYCLLV